MAGTRILDLPRVVASRLRHGDWRGLYTRQTSIREDCIASDWDQALLLADYEVRARGSSNLGTEHLVLGLMSLSGGPVNEAFRRAGVEPAQVRQLVAEFIPQGTTSWDLPRTLSAGEVAQRSRFVGSSRRVIEAQERAFRLSVKRGHSSANAAHLLAAILADRRTTGHQMLRRAGVNTRKLKRAAYAACDLAM
jgi:ATP-dependent Clp protease ATP-binding subunit ClpA